MTRLIDADAIPWLVEGVGEISVITKDEIDAMPTVDAIPINWIEAQIEEAGYSGYDMHAYELATMLEEWKEKERKDEYVTLHHEDIHFNSEEDEKAFYEALAEMKNTRSFTAEEWEFYKKVNMEKMQKTGLNIRDFMGEERKE